MGIRFLKHVARTRLLYHVVDVLPLDEGDPVENIKTIQHELAEYSEDLLHKEQWLVLNKVDQLTPEEAASVCDKIVKALDWKGRVFVISGLAQQGLDELANATMHYLDQDSDEV